MAPLKDFEDEDQLLQKVLEASRREEEERNRAQLEAAQEQSRQERQAALESDMLRKQRLQEQARLEEYIRRAEEASVRDEQEWKERRARITREELAIMDQEFGTRSEQAASRQGLQAQGSTTSSPRGVPRAPDPAPARNTPRNPTTTSTTSSHSETDRGTSQLPVSRNTVDRRVQGQDATSNRPLDRNGPSVSGTTLNTISNARVVEQGREGGQGTQRESRAGPLRRTASESTSDNRPVPESARVQHPTPSRPADPSSRTSRNTQSTPTGVPPVPSSQARRQSSTPLDNRNETRDQLPNVQPKLNDSGLSRSSSARPSPRPNGDIPGRTQTIHEASRNSQPAPRPNSSVSTVPVPRPRRRDTDQAPPPHRDGPRPSSPPRRNTIQERSSRPRASSTTPGPFPGASNAPRTQTTDYAEGLIGGVLAQLTVVAGPPRTVEEQAEEDERLLQAALAASQIDNTPRSSRTEEELSEQEQRDIRIAMGNSLQQVEEPEENAAEVAEQRKCPSYEEALNSRHYDAPPGTVYKLEKLFNEIEPPKLVKFKPLPLDEALVISNKGLKQYFEDLKAGRVTQQASALVRGRILTGSPRPKRNQKLEGKSV